MSRCELEQSPLEIWFVLISIDMMNHLRIVTSQIFGVHVIITSCDGPGSETSGDHSLRLIFHIWFRIRAALVLTARLMSSSATD